MLKRRFIQIALDVPWSLQGVRCALGALTAVNRVLMSEARARGDRVPLLYRSGVRYAKQPPETFLTWPKVLARGVGDCDQLCGWRAAELQERGVDARAVPIMIRPALMHVVIRFPNGRIEDPSKRLGMGMGGKRAK